MTKASIWLLLVAAGGYVSSCGITGRGSASPGGNVFYVSNTDGDDRNSGRSPDAAWKTFAPARFTGH